MSSSIPNKSEITINLGISRLFLSNKKISLFLIYSELPTPSNYQENKLKRPRNKEYKKVQTILNNFLTYILPSGPSSTPLPKPSSMIILPGQTFVVRQKQLKTDN